MSHNIYKDEYQFYHVAASVPMWHGLAQVSHPATVREMAGRAGIDHLRYCTVAAQVGDFSDDSSMLVCELHSKKILGLFSNGYNCAPVSALIERAEEISRALKLHDDSCIAAGVLGGDKPAKIWLQVATESTRIFDLDIDNYIMVSNSWDGSSPFQVTAGSVAVVCQNTYNMATRGGISARAKNTERRDVNLDSQIKENLTSVADAIADYRAQQSSATATLEAWGHKKVSREDVIAFIEFIAPNRARKTAELSPATIETRDQLQHALIASPGIRMVPDMSALWLWQAFTWWVTHQSKLRDGQERATNDLFGAGQNARDKMAGWLNAL